MSVTNRLVFNVTDADTIAASSSVGAFVRSSDGTLIGNVSDALKVSLTNASLTVTATDLDIRNLSASQDNVAISDGTNTLAITAAGKLNAIIEDGGNSITVDGTVAATQSGTWDIGTLGTITNVVHVDDNAGSLTVDGTVAATQSGSWTVAATQSGTWSTRTQDGSGNAINSTSNALNVYMTGGTIDVQNEANTAIESTAKSVSTTGALLTSELAARKFLFVQNLGTKHVYVGKSGVTTSNGLQLAPGMIAELQLGPALSLHAVSQAGSQDVRIMELS